MIIAILNMITIIMNHITNIKKLKNEYNELQIIDSLDDPHLPNWMQ